MTRFAALLFALVASTALLAQSGPYETRNDAIKGLAATDPARRADAVIWIADHGTSSDDAILRPMLQDKSAVVRELAEQGTWMLWNRSGDATIDALMAKGGQQMQAAQFNDAIATFAEVIARKPAFAEGWNKRATAYFLAGDLKRSLADCDEVIKRSPHHFGVLAGYGQIYFELKQYEKAIAYWQRALKANPNMVSLEGNIEIAEKLLAQRRSQSA